MEQSSEQELEHLCNSSEDVAVGVLPERHVTKFLDLSEEANLDDSEGEDKFSNLNISETETGKTEDTGFDCGAEELNFGQGESGVSYPKECPLREVDSNERQTVCSSVCTHLANDRLSELQNSKDKFTTFNSTSCTLSNDKKTDSLSSTVGMANETSGINDKDVVRIAGKPVNFYTSGHLLTGEELLAYCQWLHQEHVEETKHDPGALTCTVVGLVSFDLNLFPPRLAQTIFILLCKNDSRQVYPSRESLWEGNRMVNIWLTLSLPDQPKAATLLFYSV